MKRVLASEISQFVGQTVNVQGWVHRALSVRRLDTRAIFRVQAEIIASFRDFLGQKGFTEIQTPKIVLSATARH